MSAEKDHIKRVRGSTPVGTLTFLVTRAAVPYLEFQLFKGLGPRLLTTLGLRTASVLKLSVSKGVFGLGSIPSLVLGMQVVEFLRQGYWAVARNSYEMPIGQAISISAYNVVMDSINTLATIRLLADASMYQGLKWTDALGWEQWAGLGLFVAGMAIEMGSEESRILFKSNPKNNGKIDDTGLFGVVRHPNYFGYTIWRTGAALASGESALAVGIALFHIAFFKGWSIPALQGYMEKRYADQWPAYERKVPYALIPGVL